MTSFKGTDTFEPGPGKLRNIDSIPACQPNERLCRSQSGLHRAFKRWLGFSRVRGHEGVHWTLDLVVRSQGQGPIFHISKIWVTGG